MEIFNRAKPGGSNDAVPTMPTIADLVARVRQPAALKLALQSWRDIQGRYQSLSEELRQATAALQQAGGDGAANVDGLIRKVTELHARVRVLGETARDALEAVIAARPPWIAAVTAALEPHGSSTADSE